MHVPYDARIALISLPAPWAEEPAMNPPLGLGYLAALLIQAGWTNLKTFDATILPNPTPGSHPWYKFVPNAEVYLISCSTPQFRSLREAIMEIRTRAYALSVVGGPHATACPEDCMDAKANIVVSGEADTNILRAMCNTERWAWRTNHVNDLDSLPFPARHLWPLKEYHRQINGRPAVHIVTLRGCPYDCAFCATQCVSRKTRFRSVENVMLEIDDLRATWGYEAFVIYDDQFLLSPERVARFCNEFRHRGIQWRCWSRADLVRRDLLERMKNSGLTSITIGIESGDDAVLKRANKKTTAENNRKALLACREAGVAVRCSLMYGLPGETAQSLQNTIDLVRECQPDEWNLSVFCPMPGSDIWDHPEKYGVSFDKEWVKSQDYLPTARFGESGIGTIWIDLDTMGRQELQDRLSEFVANLERVCPRRQIQDSIQTIDTSKAILRAQEVTA